MTNTLTLRNLQQSVYQQAKEKNKFPGNADMARIGYFYWFGKLSEELWERWYWDSQNVKLGNSRFYRGRVRVALTEMLRCWMLGRTIRGEIMSDLEVLPLQMGTFSPPALAAIALLSKPDVFEQDFSAFFGAALSVCNHTGVKYKEVILSLTKGEGE